VVSPSPPEAASALLGPEWPEQSVSTLSDTALAQFDYTLPEELIAQQPVEPRDAARLLVLDRSTGRREHRTFCDLPDLLRPNDVLIANRTRVLAARLCGRRIPSGGIVEALLLARRGPAEWEALVRPGRRLPPGAMILLESAAGAVEARVGRRLGSGGRVLHLADAGAADRLTSLGSPPVPPYIRGWSGDPERYQTVYGDRVGSAAAPTAGLHFTPELLNHLRAAGVGMEVITLHVGVDTFRPIRAASIAEHAMHAEWVEVPGPVVTAIGEARERGGRAIAVGTTTVRALESAALLGGPDGWVGDTSLFITPGHHFRLVDALITNFHLPRSTLMVLVSAFAGRDLVFESYRDAIERRYRFYSFGDAMLIE
jgi:S-adenosylmethionine:tRNA ribosyltransferase-isomerase